MSEADVHAGTDAVPAWVRLVWEKVQSLRPGAVQLVVHDGRVTQIECTEKTRLTDGPRGPGTG